MSLEEIEKLRARVEKDINSRLFVPLAEEYRKAGMLDEAVMVLLNGLERQPGYTSARVALGRLYIEKSMVTEARDEFEKVVSAIPDNLFAHKKLAEIYKDMKDTDRAIAEYREVVKLNPLDEDAKTSLENLERISGMAPEEPVAFASATAQPEYKAEDVAKEEPVIEEHHDIIEEPSEIPAEIHSEEDFEQFKSSFSDRSAMSPHHDEEEFFGIPENQVFDLKEAQKEEPASGAEIPEITVEIPAPPEDESETPLDVFEVNKDTAETSPDFSSVIEDEIVPATPIAESAPDLSSADEHIAKGDFRNALLIYKGMQETFPDNREILQRVAELKQLLKLTGGSDEVIAKLEALLDGIKRRKDEFLRSS